MIPAHWFHSVNALIWIWRCSSMIRSWRTHPQNCQNVKGCRRNMTEAGTIKAIHPVAANLQRLSSQRVRKLKQLLRPTLVIKNQHSQMSSKPTGTLMIDATCAPSNVRFPQDFSLLNESRENWEGLFAGSVRITENTFQGHTSGKPGRTTLDWQNADAKIQRRSGRSSVSSLAM